MGVLKEGKEITPPAKQNISKNNVIYKQQDGKTITPPPKTEPKSTTGKSNT